MDKFIKHNRDQLNQFHLYHNFLQAVCPPGKKILEAFQTPADLMYVFDCMENENLLIIQTYTRRANVELEEKVKYKDEIEKTQIEVRDVRTKEKQLEKISNQFFEHIDEKRKSIN